MRVRERILAVFCGIVLVAVVARGVEYDVVVLDPNASCIAVADGKQAGCAEVADANGQWSQHAVIWRGEDRERVDLNPAGRLTSQVWDTRGGRQVGMADNHAVLWSSTAQSVVDLNPPGCEYSCAYGVWGNHQVGVGIARTVGEHALLWSGTAESVVDLHPEGFATSRAGGVWNGFQVGYGVLLDGGQTDWRALLWFRDGGQGRRSPPGGLPMVVRRDAWGIWQVGRAFRPAGVHAGALVVGHGPERLNLHPEGFRWSYAVRSGRPAGGGGGRSSLLWSGSPQSVVALHRFVPSEYTWSGAFRNRFDRSDRGICRERGPPAPRRCDSSLDPCLSLPLCPAIGVRVHDPGGRWRAFLTDSERVGVRWRPVLCPPRQS
jgi:hypothetical protein